VNFIDAARLLYAEGSAGEALAILEHTRDSGSSDEFLALLAILEVALLRDMAGTHQHVQRELLPHLFGSPYWERRTLGEQGNFFEWAGLIAFGAAHFEDASEFLSRAASLGRDSSLLWRTLGTLCLDRGEFELGVRYLKRSLQILRQTDLGLVGGREYPIGFFTGQKTFSEALDVGDYMRILLTVTRIAKGRRNLKIARELLIEMIHQFPNEHRLGQIRLMLEKNIVESSVLNLGIARPRIEGQRIPLISSRSPDI
jgi:tetratricopeptide (TPR) repeat protein